MEVMDYGHYTSPECCDSPVCKASKWGRFQSPALSEAITEASGAERQLSTFSVESNSSWTSLHFEEPGLETNNLSASLGTWGAEDVREWLLSLNLGSRSIEGLQRHALTGPDLANISSSDLSAMGVKALGDRKRILKTIKQLTGQDMQAALAEPVGSSSPDAWAPWTPRIMFVAAAPLVRVDGPSVHQLPVLDFDNDVKAIRSAIAHSGKECHFESVHANVRTLSWSVLHEPSSLLIYSGDALEDGMWLLETESGEARPFDPRDLFQENQSLLESAKHSPKLSPSEILATAGTAIKHHSSPGNLAGTMAQCRIACIHTGYPERAAQAFLNAGVAHVITLDRRHSARASHCASIFLECFVASLLNGESIQQSFTLAKATMHAREASMPTASGSSCLAPGANLNPHRRCFSSSMPCPDNSAAAQAEQPGFELGLRLLPSSESDGETINRNHEWSVWRPPPAAGTPQIPPEAWSMAPTQGSSTTSLFGKSGLRRIETWRVLRALRFRRLVQVMGPRNSGKRMLVSTVSEYARQRGLFAGGIHHVHVSDLCNQPQKATASPGDEGIEFMSFLAKTPVFSGHRLLILDGCDALLQDGRQTQFTDWITRLLVQNPELHLLLTATTLCLKNDGGSNPAELYSGTLDLYCVEVSELSQQDATQLLQLGLQASPSAALPFGLTTAGLVSRLSLLLSLAPILGSTAEEDLQVLVSTLPQHIYGALQSLAALPGAFSLAEAQASLAASFARAVPNDVPEAGESAYSMGASECLQEFQKHGAVCSVDVEAIASLTWASGYESGGCGTPPMSASLCLHPFLRRLLQ
mmetsp:Transcript_76025/g.180916  ORF Transcript_76025/g.180916 Transcript_76025/m.180916 type:complete len:813 (+) Transcript_76025:175-2613(+)